MPLAHDRRGDAVGIRPAAKQQQEAAFPRGMKVVAVGPEAVNGNEDNGNGHHVDGIGPTVEPVLGNGHHEGAPESQRSLFSWAEFLAK